MESTVSRLSKGGKYPSFTAAEIADESRVSRTHRRPALVRLHPGPYRFTRNPMYLGLVIVTLGIAVWVGAWPMFIAPIAVFATANWVHIPFEEVKMRRQFGATYDGYVGRVRRWV